VRKAYNLSDIARAADLMVIPPGGAWVAIVGCPVWPRGARLIEAHRKAGIQHMDVYWASNEVPVSEPIVNRFGRRRGKLVSQLYYDISRNPGSAEECFERAVAEYQGYFEESPYRRANLQTSYVTIVHPHPEEVRFFNSEVRVFGPNTVRMLLAENQVETIFFGQSSMPVLDGLVAELVDALQLDGLSKGEALHEALTGGVIEPEEVTGWQPYWFYRPRGWFRRQFCEEEA